MIDINVVLDALGVLCNANVTSIQKQRSQPGGRCFQGPQQQLSIKQLVLAVLDADETCHVSRCSFHRILCLLDTSALAAGHPMEATLSYPMEATLGYPMEAPPGHPMQAPPGHPMQAPPVAVEKKNFCIDETEFFAPKFDYDFTNLTDRKEFWRGGERYERPCGWYRFALNVLDKYDGKTWLGTTRRSTESCPGEWPVSFHGTSKKGAEGIIGDHYKPGPGQKYGRGIYSTPVMSEAIHYTKTFTCSTNGKRYNVILQNRINPEYRKKYNNDKYWLVPIPEGASDEHEMVDRAIRPYGLLLKEI